MDRLSSFQLTKYVVFNILGTLSYSCYALADTYFIAKAFGITGMTALNFAVSLMYVINGTALMLAMGGAIKFAVTRGENDQTQGNAVFSSAMILCLIAGSISLLTGIFLAEPVAVMMGADDSTMYYTVIYIRTLLCFGVAFFLNNTVTAFVRNDGAPKLAMAGMVIGSFSNIVLDYVFIFHLGMGVFGGALASCIAPLISLAVQAIHFLRKKNSFTFQLCTASWHLCSSILAYGASSLITEGLPGIVLIFTNLCLLSLVGNIGVAAFGVLTNTALVATAVFTGIAQGIQPMASTAYSREDNITGWAVFCYAVQSALLLAIFICIIVFICANQIAAVFNSEHDPTMAALACRGLRLYFIGYIFAGFNIAVSAYLSAVAQPRQAFFIAIQRCGLIMIPAVLVMSVLIGVDGVWLSFPAAEALVAFYSVFCALQIYRSYISASR